MSNAAVFTSLPNNAYTVTNVMNYFRMYIVTVVYGPQSKNYTI